MCIDDIVNITVVAPVVVVTKNCSKPALEIPFYDCDNKGENVRMVCSSCKTVIGYMNVPNIVEDRAYWHGDYTDGIDPKNEGEYLICCEYKDKIKIGEASYRKGKFYSHTMFCANDKILGWSEFPKISENMFKELAS
jgi:hypothetical protein